MLRDFRVLLGFTYMNLTACNCIMYGIFCMCTGGYSTYPNSPYGDVNFRYSFSLLISHKQRKKHFFKQKTHQGFVRLNQAKDCPGGSLGTGKLSRVIWPKIFRQSEIIKRIKMMSPSFLGYQGVVCSLSPGKPPTVVPDKGVCLSICRRLPIFWCPKAVKAMPIMQLVLHICHCCSCLFIQNWVHGSITCLKPHGTLR